MSKAKKDTAKDDGAADGGGGDNTGSADGAPLTFEASLAALEDVVTRLERGDLTLDQSLKAYEEGVRLAAAAKHTLESMQTRLDQLLDDGSTRPMKKQSDRQDEGPSS
jgi:exodeoxyribonuclease VII small subunit